MRDFGETYGQPRTKDEISEALQSGTSLDRLIREDTSQHQASRLAYWATSISYRSGEVFASLETMRKVIKARSIAEVQYALKIIIKKWKLFIRDSEELHILRPNHKKNETRREFRDRVRQTIRTQVAVLWRVRDLTEDVIRNVVVEKNLPSPHSNQDFMTELACKSWNQISMCLANAEKWEYTRRFGGDGKS